MKRFALLLILCSSSAFAECNPWKIEQALSNQLENIQPKDIPATNVASTDGGLWRIFREPDGRLNTIIRYEFGESYRREIRLSVINRSTYGIAVSNIRYLYEYPYFDAESNGVSIRNISYFYYCDGKPFLRNNESFPNYREFNLHSGFENQNAYSDEALKIRNEFIDDPDVQEITKGLRR